ncbi:MAG TPA: phosphoribosylformylglycinamidine synthase subunit PurQ [Candidatus Stackebrandtia faecavium]|nr:phosphoribosylformylglycinamidine synthase subunit PurQ [Candidatus Stackebrandtia faecavium]
MNARIGVVTFPGSLDDTDTARAIRRVGASPVRLWHDDTMLRSVSAVVLPGGFSYGDYLRGGAIARFSPIMETVIAAAREGLPVLGICNGFQILCESHLLPGALTRNAQRRYHTAAQTLEVEATDTAWTGAFESGSEIVVPVKHGEGRFVADDDTIRELENENRIVLRYTRLNPNGSFRNIAAVTNRERNVVGMMPHPEHAIDSMTGPSTHGRGIFESVLAGLGVAA